MARLMDFLIRWRTGGLLLALLLTAAAWPLANQVRFDRRIESMFAADDPLLAPFAQLKRTFGGNHVVLVAYDDPQALTVAGLERVKELSKRLSAAPGVEAAVSPLDNPVKHLLLLEAGKPIQEVLEGLLLGADRRTIGVLCFLYPHGDARAEVAPEESVARIRQIAQELQPGAMIVGEPAMVADGFAYLEEDGRTLTWLTTVLTSLVVLVCFRSLRWMLIPLVVVQAAVVWTRAGLVLLGFQMSMVSSMLAAMITVVGVGTVVHLMIRFREEKAERRRSLDAFYRASVLVAAPILWSIVTDVVGFSSLAASKVGPVQAFGWMMALGAVMTLVSAMLIIPGLALWGAWDASPSQVYGEGFLSLGLDGLVASLRDSTRSWNVVVLVGAAVCFAGYFRLEAETDFTKNFRSDSPIVQSYRFVESRLGGAGVWDLVVPAPDRLNDAFLTRIRGFQDRLRREVHLPTAEGGARQGLTKVVSIVDMLDAADRVGPSGLLPLEYKLSAMQAAAGPLYRSLYGVDPESPNRKSYYRIMLRSLEQQTTAEKLVVLEKVQRIATEEFDGEERATGFFVLLAALVDRLLSDQWRSFLLAVFGVAVTLWIALGNRWLALIALVPNALPIFVVLGLMGHLGWKVNMGTVMIAAVSMGLSVDSSIHYLTELRRKLKTGLPLEEALRRVHGNVGKAMIFSSLAFVVGFLGLSGSHFVPTIYFGVLVSLSILGGLAGNLVVLPLILLSLRDVLESELRPQAPPAAASLEDALAPLQ